MIVCVLGAPGAGKSTMIKALLGVDRVLHVGRLAKEIGHVENRDPGALVGGWHQIIAGPLAEAVAAGGLTVLDGFPRSTEQAEWLRAAFPTVDIKAVVVPMDKDQSLASMARRGDAPEKARAKFARWLDKDVPAVAKLADLGVPVTTIARRSREAMADDLFKAVWGFDLQAAPWDWEAFADADRILTPLGITWEVAHGAVARPIWTARGFGPAQLPTDLDLRVQIDRLEEARTALAAGGVCREWTAYPIETIRTGDCFTSDRVVARYQNGRVTLINKGDPSDMADLFHGRLVKLPGFEARYEPKMIKKIAAYPLLNGATRSRPVKIKGICRPETGPIADQIRAMASVLQRDIPMPPVGARKSSRTPAPAADALLFEDADWRDWLIRVFRSHRDEFRQQSPGCHTLFKIVFFDAIGMIRPAHTGGQTSAHHVNVGFFLDTSGMSRVDARDLRIAALAHDIGKLSAQRVAGAHGAAGARLILSGVVPLPEGCNRERIADLVARHDVPGKVIKGCLDPLDPGSQPLSVLSCLSEEHWRLWRADVSAVPRWRWTLDLEPMLRRAIK